MRKLKCRKKSHKWSITCHVNKFNLPFLCFQTDYEIPCQTKTDEFFWMPNYLERTMINRELKWKWKELLRAQKFKKNSTLDNFTPNFLCPLVTFLNFEITTEMEEGGNKQHSFHMLLTSEPQSYHRIWCVTMNGWTNMFSGAKGPIFLHSCHIDLIL